MFEKTETQETDVQEFQAGENFSPEKYEIAMQALQQAREARQMVFEKIKKGMNTNAEASGKE